MKQSGIVYIITNRYYRKDCIKVGVTRNSIEQRIADLFDTGVPYPFEPYATYHCSNIYGVESFIHKVLPLKQYKRIYEGREFFEVDPRIVLELMIHIKDLLGEGTITPISQDAIMAMSKTTHKVYMSSKTEWLANTPTKVDKDKLSTFIDKMIESGFTIAIGTADLIFRCTGKDGKNKSILMLWHNGRIAAFQPMAIHECGDNADYCLDMLRQFLSTNQKNKTPYTVERGYYFISFQTLCDYQDDIVRIFSYLVNKQ